MTMDKKAELVTNPAFQNLSEASAHVLKLASELIPVNSFFVAMNDRKQNYIVKAFHREKPLFPDGIAVPFEETYCSHVIRNEGNVVRISNVQSHEWTASMPITKLMNFGAYLGVALTDKKGEIRGTLCAIHSEPFEFTDAHVDELSSFSKLLTYVVELTNLEKDHDAELEKAKRIQMSVLSPNFEDDSLKVDGFYFPSNYLSGDMYHWAQIDEHRYGVLLIDVMGHGVSASLISMALRSLMNNLIRRVADPKTVFKELNRHMHQLLPNNMISYATGMYVLIDTKEQTVEYVGAGHPPGVLLVDHKERKMESHATALGLKESQSFVSEKVYYKKSVRFCLYTDGVLELLKNASLHDNYVVISRVFKRRETEVVRRIMNLSNTKFQFPDDVSIILVETKQSDKQNEST